MDTGMSQINFDELGDFTDGGFYDANGSYVEPIEPPGATSLWGTVLTASVASAIGSFSLAGKAATSADIGIEDDLLGLVNAQSVVGGSGGSGGAGATGASGAAPPAPLPPE